MRDRAQLVVIGAGIVGASAAYHLAELGITDVLVLDQGPLFETGGSTSHAPGLVFQTNGSRTMCRLAQYSVDLYSGLETEEGPAWYGVGGIEVATTPERIQELKRRRGYALAYGIEGTELLTPEETAERIPILDPGHILGSYLVPSDGIAKGVRVAAALGAKAQAKGVTFEGGVRVTGFDIQEGRVHGVRTDQGDVACEQVLVCAGIWGPTIGRMAGVPIPLAVVQHQLVWTEPLPELAADRDAGDRPSDPPAPGRLAVLPAAGRSVRAGELPARADPVRAGRSAPVSGRRAAAEHRAVHARALRRGVGGERPAAPARAREGRRLDRDQRDVLVHAGHGLDRGRVGRRPRVLDLRGRVGDARRRDGTDGGRVDRGRRALDGPGRGRREPVLPVHDDGAVRARRAARSSTARSTTSCIRSSRCRTRAS